MRPATSLRNLLCGRTNDPRRERSRLRPLAAAGLTAAAILVAGCGSAGDPSAAYFPAKASAPSSGIAVTSGAGPATRNPLLGVSGKVARPKPELTPGAVSLTDINKVCQLPKHVAVQISITDQQAAYSRYGIVYPQGTAKYKLDYLIPLQLGGAATLANIWPASVRGIGYQQKQQLNFRLRKVVCDGEVPLDRAQQLVASDWYSAWLQYGTGT
jgi:hypothetical protein